MPWQLVGNVKGPPGSVKLQPTTPTIPATADGWMDTDEPYISPPNSPVNDTTNPGPYSALTGWVAGGGSLSLVPDARYSRGNRAQTSFTGPYSSSVASPLKTVAPGDPRSGVTRVHVSRAQNVVVAFALYKNGTYVTNGVSKTVAVAADTPTVININIAALPAGDYNQARVNIDLPNAASGDTAAHGDTRTAPVNDAALVFQDGRSGGWAFTGAMDISESVQAVELRPLYFYDGSKWIAVADPRMNDVMNRATAVENRATVLETDRDNYYRKAATLLRYDRLPEDPLPYPESAYGFISATVHPDDCLPVASAAAITANTLELGRLWVPPEKIITGAWSAVGAAGVTPGSSGVSGYRLYSDDGQTVLGTTPTDYALFTTAGLRSKAFASPIAASTTGYWARLGLIHTCTGTAAKFLCGPNIGSAFLSGNVLGASHRRFAYASAGSPAAWPATFTPASYGTLDAFAYLMGLY